MTREVSIVRMGASQNGALKAAEEATRSLSMEERTAMGIVVGTTVGCLDVDREFDESRREAEGRYASPAAFSRTLPSSVVSEVALKLGVKGPTVVVCEGALSTALAIRRGEAWMRQMGLGHCLVGGIEGETCGMILLGNQAHGARAIIEARRACELRLECDWSLKKLMQWIEAGGRREIGGGVQLVSGDQ